MKNESLKMSFSVFVWYDVEICFDCVCTKYFQASFHRIRKYSRCRSNCVQVVTREYNARMRGKKKRRIQIHEI